MKTAQAAIFDAAAERVCRQCTLCSLCWNKDYEKTVNAFNDVSNILKNTGRALPEDYPDYFENLKNSKWQCRRRGEHFHRPGRGYH